ncbi:hypothetical protein [Nocardia aurantia]|uniref:DUF8020 domain-containing protein n=1 Tax=Nocardia aurantia TaxID=2585199 RepID=A0A7K0DHN7_9NOCA|nr:hypothetical protein [Nocardia aurantia]MQY24812.1 hypothetical protein [Nocardia aurantia]
MKIRAWIGAPIIAALTVGAVGAATVTGSGTATAAPDSVVTTPEAAATIVPTVSGVAAPGPGTPGSVQYSVKLVDHTVLTTLTGATFRLAPDGKAYDIADGSGATVMTLPTAVSAGGTAIPVAAEVREGGTVLALTPQATAPAGTTVDSVEVHATPIASPRENTLAQQAFATQFGLATAVGGFLGTAAGVVIGAIAGCALGLPLFGVGCIPAAITGAGIGGIIGTLVVGGPALIAAAVDLINTLQAAPGSSPWAENAPK